MGLDKKVQSNVFSCCMLVCVCIFWNGIFRQEQEILRAWCPFRRVVFWLIALMDSYILSWLTVVLDNYWPYQERSKGKQQQPWRDWEARKWGGNNLKLSKTIFTAVGQTWAQLLWRCELHVKRRCPWVTCVLPPGSPVGSSLSLTACNHFLHCFCIDQVQSC